MGKRVISSLFGVPIILYAAIFIYIILQATWELAVGDNGVLKIILLISAILGLMFLVAFSFMKKKTAVRILTSSMGVR